MAAIVTKHESTISYDISERYKTIRHSFDAMAGCEIQKYMVMHICFVFTLWAWLGLDGGDDLVES